MKIFIIYFLFQYTKEENDESENTSEPSKIQFVVEDVLDDEVANKNSEEDKKNEQHSPKVMFHHIDECPIDDTDSK